MIPAPFNLPLDVFLRGPNQSKPLDIDQIFTTNFDTFHEENKVHFPVRYDEQSVTFLKHSSIIPSITYVSTWYGVIMLNGNKEAIGCYLWSALSLSDLWQGKGLGRELVITRLLNDGINPVWNLSVPAYSPAGYACHVSAWRYINGQYGRMDHDKNDDYIAP